MSWRSLGRLLSGIKGAYNDINPSTLTGAIDVIVVQQPDGTYTCGPFYVRFGKLTAISPADKSVEFYVNGKYVDFLPMRLGAAGDAYFVDSDTCSSDDEKYTINGPEMIGIPEREWPDCAMRRRRRKVRHNSAMSEPDCSTLLDELHENTAPQSDSEHVADHQNKCSSLINHFGSESILIDEFHAVDKQLRVYGDILDSCVRSRPEFNKSLPTRTQESPDSSTAKNSDNGKQQMSSPKSVEVYLEDLVTSEVDPVVKETYIYPPTHPSFATVPSGETYYRRSVVETNSVDAGYKSDGEHTPRSLSPIYPTIYGLKLSLCGPPSSDSPVSDEKFLEHLVSFEEFIVDPDSILANPNLTVQLNSRYLSWPLAAPSIISILAFQTELPHRTVRQLEHVHMSKKQNRRTSWFSWGSKRVEAEEPDENKAVDIAALPEVIEESSPVVQPSRESGTSETENIKMHCFHKRSSLSSTDISRLDLKRGRNDIEFRVTTKYQGTCICSASIFLWHWSDKIVISDVDGTITRSDLLGHLLPMVGHDWTHAGVARLYDHIVRNGYRVLYLSARALGQAGITRSYLRHVVQGSVKLPDGPVLLSPNSLLRALHQEVIEKKPETFKIKCLSDVAALFPKGCKPLYAGFGNKINDVFAYEKVGIERCRIFTVNPRGELRNEYHCAKNTSYGELDLVVDLHFPLLVDESQRQIITFTGDGFLDSVESSATGRTFRRSSIGAESVDMSLYSCFTYWKMDQLDTSLIGDRADDS